MERWTTRQVAEYLDVRPATWRNYRTEKYGPKGNRAPEPDGWYDGRTPWWWDETIKAWNARRPGRGRWREEG